ncbi:MAG: hypothetical protein VKO21_08365 [Candidatus Sericytochromatia bacterium]|nr:hypothetical protein [Candidatus Sericytochromatia bacterium]
MRPSGSSGAGQGGDGLPVTGPTWLGAAGLEPLVLRDLTPEAERWLGGCVV